MEIDHLINTLHKRLSDYKKSDLYLTKPLRQDILSVEIATCIFEMAIYCKRTITEEEKDWFKGGYYISSDITGEWGDIASMYDQVVRFAKDKGLIN